MHIAGDVPSRRSADKAVSRGDRNSDADGRASCTDRCILVVEGNGSAVATDSSCGGDYGWMDDMSPTILHTGYANGVCIFAPPSGEKVESDANPSFLPSTLIDGQHIPEGSGEHDVHRLQTREHLAGTLQAAQQPLPLVALLVHLLVVRPMVDPIRGR